MLSIDIATRTKSDVPVQEEIVRIFVENYSLFVGINVYLPQIIVRIFVDFDWIFVRIFVVWKEKYTQNYLSGSLVETEKRVIPIEAKAEENVKGKSLKTYIDEHPALKGLRVSMKNYIDQGWMENLPLYAIEGYLRAEGIPIPEQGE